MKKLFKPLSLALSALMLIGCLTACSEPTPTPEEIYEKVEKATDAKLTMEMEVAEMMSTKATMEKDGDKTYTKTESEALGQKFTDETYTETKGDKLITYTKDGDKWVKTETDKEEDDEDDDSLNAFKELFNSKNFGEFNTDKNRYEMKKGATVEADGMQLSEAYIEVKDDTFVIYAKLDMNTSGMEMSGSLKITVKLTDVSIDLPKV